MIGDKRHRVDLETSSWHEAADRRDAWEDAKGLPRARRRVPASERMPTFADLAKRYLEEDVAHLAATTRTDRRLHLAEEGAVMPHLGKKRLDEVTAATLREWWNAEIQNTARTNATGQRYVASIAGVFNYAVELGCLAESPVDPFRRSLARRERTKQGRAGVASKARPIEDREALGRLVTEARAEGAIEYAMVLAMLDAGVRRGRRSRCAGARSRGGRAPTIRADSYSSRPRVRAMARKTPRSQDARAASSSRGVCAARSRSYSRSGGLSRSTTASAATRTARSSSKVRGSRSSRGPTFRAECRKICATRSALGL